MTFDIDGILYVALMALVIAPYGIVVSRNFRGRSFWIASGISVAVIYYLLQEGGYWAIFPRGEGFFTANRVTAGIVYLFAFAIGPLIDEWRWQRGGKQAALAHVETLKKQPPL